jgi:pyruvate dehydrogenase kinase 2/3/4
MTLRQLLFFGRAMNEERLIKSANYVRTELPVRIAHRLRDLQALPYVVVTNEGVAKVYEMYWDAFERFRRFPPIENMQDNERFCVFLGKILSEHNSVIPALSLGLSLSSPYLPPDQLDAFMRRMLVSRISRRVLAEHHISLSQHHNNTHNPEEKEPHVGIIFIGLNVSRSIRKCCKLLRDRPLNIEGLESLRAQEWPEVIIDGHQDISFAYLREQLEYIIFELIKNAMYATALHHRNADSLPPIRATVVGGQDSIGIRISDQGGGLWTSSNPIRCSSDLFSFSHVRNAMRMEDSRIGGLRNASTSPLGIRATIDEQLGRWQDQDPEKKAGISPHQRIGIGLPMSNIFATYFGGSLELVSLDGWGTDVYLRLPKLGTNLEGIEV